MLALLLALFTLVVRQFPSLDITQRPQPIAPVVSSTAVAPSWLALPITIPLEDLAARLGEDMPKMLVEKRVEKHNRHINIKVWRTGELRIEGENNQLRLLLPVAFDADAPDEGLFEPHLHTSGKVLVRADVTLGINNDWQPQVSVRPSFTWVRKPYFYIGPFKIHIAGLLGEEIQEALDKQARKLQDKVAGSLKLKHKAERAWKKLFEPKRLSRKPLSWLVMQPQSIHWQAPHSDAQNLYLSLGLVARLSTVLGPKPGGYAPTPLPPLSKQLAKPLGFRLQVPVLLDFAGIDASLLHKLGGRRVQLNHGALVLRGFETYASGQRLVLGVQFQAQGLLGDWLNTRGSVYLTGVPHYDPATRVISVSDFNFTRQVDNPLVSFASWVLQDKLRQTLGQQLQWDATGEILDAQEDLNDDLNQPLGDGLYLAGELTQLQLLDMQLTARGIVLRFDAQGQAALRYNLPESGSAAEQGH